MRKALRILVRFLVLPLVGLVALALVWLKLDSARPLEDYFDERQGAMANIEGSVSTDAWDQVSHLARITSDSGLGVTFRVIRPTDSAGPLPVLVVLGGHRTGSDAVDLFGNVGEQAVVALDYPYDGPEKIRGIRQTLTALPLARQAFRDTPAAVALVLDWVEEQSWADNGQIVIIGASLGVPFAALIAARDPRIDAAILVHGAADNLAWLETQVARRNDARWLHRPLATLIHWMAYGPTFDTGANVAFIAPRPLVIIGAREDERTPRGETEALYAAAGEPKVLRWTDGRHVETDRPEVIGQLLAIAAEELPRLTTDR